MVLFADLARALELHFVETHNQWESGIAQLCFLNFLPPPNQTVPKLIHMRLGLMSERIAKLILINCGNQRTITGYAHATSASHQIPKEEPQDGTTECPTCVGRRRKPDSICISFFDHQQKMRKYFVQSYLVIRQCNLEHLRHQLALEFSLDLSCLGTCSPDFFKRNFVVPKKTLCIGSTTVI